jgi:primosomal protein N' (replication factor Y)
MIEKKGLLSKNFLVPGNRDACETAEEYAVFDYVGAREKIDAKQLSQRFPQISLEVLLRRQILQEQPFLINKIADKTEPWLCPAKPDAGESLKRRPRQAALFAELVQHGAAPFTYWVGRGYSRPVLNELVSTGLARMEQRNRRTTDLTHSLTPDQPWQLNPAQERAVKAVEQDQTGKTFVLHGVTGSGKTEIYLQLTEKVLRQGRQVIVLVPEIALTGQIVRRFIRRFGNDVVVQHSQLSKGERRNNWLRMFNKESHICIGARSAIFTAVADLGLLIVDEAHDTSYKQDESPRYDAVEVARKRAAYYHCPLILGSATPSINSYYKARQGEYELLELPERVAGQALPDVSIVDMREELARGNYRVLSDELANLLNATLEQHHQAIILLNRRGFSTFVMCRKCGYVVKCETCDVAMVYHKDQGTLKCHYCDNEKPVPTVCPSCGSKYIKYFGTGTEKVEEQLRELLPQARIIRLDQDTTTRKGSGDKIIEAFRRHEYDILLGTQMVAKGHDFPDVTAVGILAADSLLNLPAYWAGERTFQLLTQAAGRSGRGNVAGRVVMQTYAPEHYVIQCSKTQDYEEFYEKEIAYRRELMYPPFHDLIKIIVTYEDSQLTWERANGLALLLRHYSQEGQMPEIIGPYVDTIKKIRNKYRVCLLIKGKDLAGIKKYIKNEADFYKTGIIIDVDPSY